MYGMAPGVRGLKLPVHSEGMATKPKQQKKVLRSKDYDYD